MQKKIYIFIAFLLCMAASAAAQDERLTANFQIQGRYGKKGAPSVYPTSYAVFKTATKARTVMDRLVKAVDTDGYPGGPEYDDALVKNNVRFKRAKASAHSASAHGRDRASSSMSTTRPSPSSR